MPANPTPAKIKICRREIEDQMRLAGINPDSFRLEVERTTNIYYLYKESRPENYKPDDQRKPGDKRFSHKRFLRLSDKLKEGYSNLGILPRFQPKQRGAAKKADDKPADPVEAVQIALGAAKVEQKSKGSHNSEIGIIEQIDE